MSKLLRVTNVGAAEARPANAREAATWKIMAVNERVGRLSECNKKD